MVKGWSIVEYPKRETSSCKYLRWSRSYNNTIQLPQHSNTTVDKIQWGIKEDTGITHKYAGKLTKTE